MYMMWAQQSVPVHKQKHEDEEKEELNPCKRLKEETENTSFQSLILCEHQCGREEDNERIAYIRKEINKKRKKNKNNNTQIRNTL